LSSCGLEKNPNIELVLDFTKKKFGLVVCEELKMRETKFKVR
jgi:hypothetical protein